MPERTRNQIIAQSLMPKLIIPKYLEDEHYRNAIQQLVRDGVAGFCVFSGSPAQIVRVMDELDQLSSEPLLYAADLEWGLPMRFEGGTAFPNAYALGVINDQPITFRIAECIALESRAVGIVWNFAPVADVLLNPRNILIGVRAFGETSQTVTQHVLPFLHGLQHNKVLACVKHFPGHGAVEQDSHYELPICSAEMEFIVEQMLPPFAAAIRYGVKSVMVSHVAFPYVEKNREIIPASLSQNIVSRLLQQELSYDGIVITDALDMEAVRKNRDDDTVAIDAKKAGNDILLMPPNPHRVIQVLVNAVQQGVLPFHQFERTYEKLTAVREWLQISDESEQKRKLRVEDHRYAALYAASQAIRWHPAFPDHILPLDHYEEIACLAFVDNDSDMEQATRAFQYFAQVYQGECNVGYIDHTISSEQISGIIEHLATSEIVLFLLFASHRAIHLVKQVERIQKIVRQIRQDRPAIALVYGLPIVAEDLGVDAVCYTYSFTEPSVAVSISQLTTVDALRYKEMEE